MVTLMDSEFARAAADATWVQHVTGLVAWVADGRKLTQTGRLTLADARHLVDLLSTADEFDPIIGGRVVRTKSSEELRELTAAVEWAKVARMVRVSGGQLLRVQKNAALVDQPAELWAVMFETFPRLGKVMCPQGWGESLMRRHFDEAVEAVIAYVYAHGGGAGLDKLCDLAWEAVTARYVIKGTPRQIDTGRRWNDRDVRRALGVLRQLGAVQIDTGGRDVGGRDEGSGDESDGGNDGDGVERPREDAVGEPAVRLTDLGLWGVRRARGEPEPAIRSFRLASS